MEKHAILFPVICIVVLLLAGCTATSPPSTNTTTPATVVTTIPVDNQTCTTDADCVPAQCCHPTSCVNQASITVCNLMCTQNCQGPLDCGAGSCGCRNGRCSVIPAASSPSKTSLQLTTFPQRYTPIMSSTVGVGITVNATGFDLAESLVSWNATYGKFLSWETNFTVQDLENSTSNHGEKLFWSFIEKPASTVNPVIVTVKATDPATGKVLGNSTITLDWDGNYAVVVKEIR